MADASSSTTATTNDAEKVTFFKKRAPKKNFRKPIIAKKQRDHSDDDDDEDEDQDVSAVVTKERKSMATPFVQSTRPFKKKKKVTDLAADLDSSDEEEKESSIGVRYSADRSTSLQTSDATRYATEWELENEVLQKSKSKSKSSSTDVKKKEVKNSKMQVGPQRAPANIRVTARFDYQPDVCKDYKETGFCGYGDSCIFLHDRGDYKTGWQLEKEWEDAIKNKTKYGQSNTDQYAVSGSDDDSDEEELPFACLICREEFTNPVVTKCNHYFCEKCALDNYKKSPKCYACGTPTSGVFNTAKNMLEKLRKKKERREAEKSDQEEDILNNGDFAIEGLEEKKDSSSSSSESDDDDDSDSD
ncbi:hypothetical protein BDC45DRAFT_522134 [Circinella umbellata]|nr:hypothetical protein BDC45DRAFT_522134 [Circinella umbellata]